MLLSVHNSVILFMVYKLCLFIQRFVLNRIYFITTNNFKARNVSYRNKEEWTYRME